MSKGKIFVVAPSAPLDLERLNPEDITVKSPAELLEGFSAMVEAWGYECCYPDDICGHEYYSWSHTPQRRAEHIREALETPDVTAIFSAIGGGGSYEVNVFLDRMNKQNPLPESNVPFICISDATSVALYLEKHNLATHVQGSSIYHFPFLYKEVEPQQVVCEQRLHQFLESLTTNAINQFDIEPLNDAAKNADTISGKLVGGCNYLPLFAHKTSYEPEWEGNILALEGYSAPGVKTGTVHGAIQALGNMCNVLEKVSAIAIGYEYGGDAETVKRQKEEVRKFAEQLNVPFFRGLQFGHNSPLHCISMGTECQIIGGEKPSITIQSLRTEKNPTRYLPPKRPSSPAPRSDWPDMGDINEADLFPINTAAKTQQLSKGVIEGVGNEVLKGPSPQENFIGNLIRNNAPSKGAHVLVSIIPADERWSMPSKGNEWGALYLYHGALTNMVLRNQLEGAQSVILNNVFPDQRWENYLAGWLKDFAEAHLPNTPVFMRSSDEKMPSNFRAQFVPVKKELSPEDQAQRLSGEERSL